MSPERIEWYITSFTRGHLYNKHIHPNANIPVNNYDKVWRWRYEDIHNSNEVFNKVWTHSHLYLYNVP